MKANRLGSRVQEALLVCALTMTGGATTPCALGAGSEAAQPELADTEWQQLDRQVEQALIWLDKQQQRDGSFPTHPGGQPAVTALCVMAFAAHGHLPGDGPYGDRLRQAMEFIGGCQKQSGLLALAVPNSEQVPRNVSRDTGNNACYNHAISATVLSELYGLTRGEQQQREIIEHAMRATLEMQQWPKPTAEEQGGWRYLNRNPHDNYQSDLSATAWELMFLRSAKNSGFDVPEQSVEAGVQYVLRTFNKEKGTFTLFHSNPAQRSRAMAGAGILALAHAGYHGRQEAKRAADFLLKMPCSPYGQDNPLGEPTVWYSDRYHYSAFLATQAMNQMGGAYWRAYFPPTVRALLNNQSPDGSWPAEKHHYDAQFGNAYTTALVVLTLGTPNQLLPIFQR